MDKSGHFAPLGGAGWGRPAWVSGQIPSVAVLVEKRSIYHKKL